MSDVNLDAIAARVPEKNRRETFWAMSVFQSLCNASGEQSNVVAIAPGRCTLQQKLYQFVLEAC